MLEGYIRTIMKEVEKSKLGKWLYGEQNLSQNLS
jgi:hypothetical protein